MPWTPSSLRKHFAGGDSSASKDTSRSLPEEDVGPHIIHNGCDKASTGVDIVFVHGLRGSRIQTWSSGSYFWPQDFLSKDLERARLITWGYDADIANAFKFTSQDSIYGHADTLLNDLARVRQPDITRPIIFICHSLGGLVVKDALIKAASHDSHKRDRDLALIYQHTKGVLFLGTPHRGSQQEPFGDLLARAANLSLHQANTQLLRSLRTDSHILEKQRDDFVTISNNLLVRCVKEERPTALGIIVSEHSANYDGFNIKKGSINADHINMVKFKSAGDQGYQRILGWINSMRSEISANTSSSLEEENEAEKGQSLPRLHMAAAAPSSAYLRHVLRESPPGSLNATNGPPNHCTPLHMAILSNLPENITILLEAGADINKQAFLQDKWWPPLFLAAGKGDAEAVEALISIGGLDPNQTFSDTNGNTPLHVAAVNNKPNVARTLLRHGANALSKDDTHGWDSGWTPLDCAFKTKDDEMIKILQEAVEQQAQTHQEASSQPLIENGDASQPSIGNGDVTH